MARVWNSYETSYAANDCELKLELKDVESQTDIGTNEAVTSAFTMLDFNAVKTFDIGGQRTARLSFCAKNLLDEVARNHSSFDKKEVPLPGRNLGVRIQITL